MKKEVLCIEDLPLFLRDWLKKRRQAYPVKGQFYTAIRVFGTMCPQYELAEYPPSDLGTGFGVLPNGWPIKMFVECEGMSEQIEAARKAMTPAKIIKCAELDLTGYNNTLYIP